MHLVGVGPAWLLIMTTTRKTTVRAHTKTVNGRVVDVATHETTVHTAAAASAAAAGVVAVSPPTVTSVVPDPVSTGRGTWQVVDIGAAAEAQAANCTRVINLIGGGSKTGPRTTVVAELYPTPSDITVRVTNGSKRHDKVTVLLKGRTLFGEPDINIVSGTLHTGSGGTPVILPTGARRNGYSLSEHTEVLDVLDGAGTKNAKVLNARWHTAATAVPVTVPVTVDALGCATEQHPINMVVYHTGGSKTLLRLWV